MAVCYEAINRSIFGPVVFNSAAPDDGNMMVLEKLGTAEQKSRWLARIELLLKHRNPKQSLEKQRFFGIKPNTL